MQHDFATALHKSLLFFRAQRSGDLTNTGNPIPFSPRQPPSQAGADRGLSILAGYFDAGDYVKYGQPAAYSVSVLAWSGIEFKAGLGTPAHSS